MEVRLTDAGPLPFPDGSFDVVFGKDAWLHIKDKPAFFREVYRVLRPGGVIAAGDWCRQPGPITPKMEHFFEAENITYSMEAHGDYLHSLEQAGFVDIRVVEFTDEYAVKAREELERFSGELRDQVVAQVGSQFYQDTVSTWAALVAVLDERSLQPSRIRALKH